MNNPAVCAPGTHLLDAAGNETAASTCWPTGIMVAPEDQFASNFPLHDKPHARADERPDSACNGSAGTGSGCGDIYVTWTEFTFSGGSSASTISLAVCRNTFTTSADCSSPITISAPSDTSTQFSHIAARPDGVVSVTYANTTGNFFNPGPTTAINYVSCVPGAHSVGSVPPPPTCAAPVLVTAETQPHPQGYFLYNQAFPTATYPTHDNRLNGGTWEEIVAWERCKVPEGVVVGSPFSGLIICPDDDIRMAIAPVDGNGVPTGAWAISDVNTSPGNQIFPWVKANHDTNAVQITYITSENDPQVYTFQLQRNTVKSNHETAGNSEVLSKTAFAPADDPWLVGGFIGDYIGMATKGNTSYFHYTGTNFQGLANGVSIFEDNNQLIKKSD
jgi:hypothetical protein